MSRNDEPIGPPEPITIGLSRGLSFAERLEGNESYRTSSRTITGTPSDLWNFAFEIMSAVVRAQHG